MKLYAHPKLPGWWIAEHDGELVKWRAGANTWPSRELYAGTRRSLVEVQPRSAAGTGWPGVPTGRPPRRGKPAGNLTIRLYDDDRERWERAAGDRSLSDWAREVLSEAARR